MHCASAPFAWDPSAASTPCSSSTTATCAQAFGHVRLIKARFQKLVCRFVSVGMGECVSVVRDGVVRLGGRIVAVMFVLMMCIMDVRMRVFHKF